VKAYIVENKKKIEPFDEYPRTCLIKNKPLMELQKESFSALGLEPILVSNHHEVDDPDEYIILNDSLYFTSELLEEFILRSKRQRTCTVCALKAGVTTLRSITSVQDVKIGVNYIEYDLCYVPKNKFRGESYPLIIDPDKIQFHIPMPKHVCGANQYSIPMSDKLIIQINHWVNLWVANILSLLEIGARLQKKSIIRKTVLAIKAMSFNRWTILSQLNKIGENCDIHPTAYIEGSTIGDNVTVGAGAIIKESVIGKDAFIGNGVIIEESVVGEKSTILSGHILYSVLYPGTFTVTQMISASLIGRDTFLGSGVIPTDFRLDGKSVAVMRDGIKVDTGNTFVGVCIGHEVYLGSGCIVAPGRIIPNGMRITPDKNRIIEKPNRDIPGFRSIKS